VAERFLIALVSLCIARARLVLASALIATLAGGFYLARSFAINTDPLQLISLELPWRKQEAEFDRAFPQRPNLLLVVVEAGAPELAESAAARLAAAISARPDLATSARRPDAGAFFEENGLLFLEERELERLANDLAAAQPLLALLARDPSIRGMFAALETLLKGLGEPAADQALALGGVDKLSDALEAGLATDAKPFSWRPLLTGQAPAARDLSRFIAVQPVLDFSNLEPGRAASDGIRAVARGLGLTPERGVRIRMTGPVALADDEFASVAENALLNIVMTMVCVAAILWFALRSGRLIAAVLLNLVVGLVVTGAVGLALIGQFNLISVAFAVLFIGLGVDFGIQIGVRCREVRHAGLATGPALVEAARQVAGPLTLAAACLMAGFYAFLPTDYRGLSELGVIAGTGMAIALATSLTVLPALVSVMDLGPERHSPGFPALARVDSFLGRRRAGVLALTALLLALCLFGLRLIRFDGNPLNLRSPQAESVAVLLDLGRGAISNPHTVDILAASAEEAGALAKRLEALPSVARAVTLSSFVPADQERKLEIIDDLRFLLGVGLDPPETAPAPDDAALLSAAARLRAALAALPAEEARKPGLIRLGALLDRFAQAGPERRLAARERLEPPLRITLDQLRTSLRAAPVSLATLPADLAADWRAADGRVRIEAAPDAALTDTTELAAFATAVREAAPGASGGAISVFEAGRTVVRAFIQAGLIAFASITLILWFALGRIRDVAWTVLPLIASGLFTLLAAALLGTPLNFANIIALPLMFGVGVAFHIYYVIAWRQGVVDVLQTSLTRAILFSALTTAAAFGSLWLSSHPGTASMGKLLAISLFFTLLTAFVIVPACLGPAHGAEPARPSG